MSMIKVIPPGSYDFGESAASLIKVSSSGLLGHDLNSLIKRAGHEFADKIRNMSFKEGEVPVHMIALGATEAIGPNANGDGFKIACCRKYHNTFVKHALAYRDHKNKDRAKSYGIVKSSCFNEAMRRIELLVVLNGNKEVAEKNGGLVAEKEMQKLAKDGTYPVSMSCSVSHDTCSSCGNNARTRKDYCLGIEDGGLCKFGGLKHNIGLVHESGHHLHADNPHPKFFDISLVHKPADRTAFVFGKVASANTVISGAELAELLQVTAPTTIYEDEITSPTIAAQVKIARQLAEKERSIQHSSNLANTFISSSLEGIEDFQPYQRSSVLKALANEKIALSLTDWLRLVTGESEDKCASVAETVKPCLPTLFNDLLENTDLVSLLESNPSRPARSVYPDIQLWATKQASAHSLDQKHLQSRLWLASIRQLQTPSFIKASNQVTPAARQLAYQYGIQQIAFLHDLSNTKDFDLTSNMVLLNNQLS